jgi:Ser/Thr protein kinase RdoA (MazF antagonist)
VSRRDQAIITKARKSLLRKLHRFAKKHPQRMGLIHADLHFGNIIKLNHGGVGVIDFDDCGFGFHAYDIAVTLISVENRLGEKRSKEFSRFKDALIEGYKTQKSWDLKDELILADLMVARRLLMLGWMNSRADNPRIKKHLKGAVRVALKTVRGSGLLR